MAGSSPCVMETRTQEMPGGSRLRAGARSLRLGGGQLAGRSHDVQDVARAWIRSAGEDVGADPVGKHRGAAGQARTEALRLGATGTLRGSPDPVRRLHTLLLPVPGTPQTLFGFSIPGYSRP